MKTKLLLLKEPLEQFINCKNIIFVDFFKPYYKLKDYLMVEIMALVQQLLILKGEIIYDCQEKYHLDNKKIFYELQRVKRIELYFFQQKFISYLAQEYNYEFTPKNYYEDIIVYQIINYIEDCIFKNAILN
ncbi:hypothetical protein [Candidatus Phytoplasma pyri]|uniref:hypothetical protein n=1 Tax=Candidatus Phytoplasma pyri TaxID=47566 RepID=UPI003983727F